MKRRALVTGGSGTLGSSICHELASRGLHVVVHANQHGDAARAIVEEIRATHGSAEFIEFDVTDSRGSHGALERVLSDGPVQVLVHSAGVHDDAIMAGMEHRQWSRVIDVSLNGFFNVVQPLLLPMIRTRWGRIIPISSIAAILGNRGQANYAAAKAGLHGAVKSLSLEVVSRGVTVNAVAPGVIQSPMTSHAFGPERIAAIVPAGRAGQPHEVAALVGFLASDLASYISGQIIGVNGGMA